MDHVREASAEALARTPDLLPVLKQAGVVDAGGTGFLLFIDALRYVATGEPIPGVTDALGLTDPDLSEAHSEISDLRWEVMFLMDAEDSGIPEFRQKWSDVGDSIVVVGGDGLWNCHIHGTKSIRSWTSPSNSEHHKRFASPIFKNKRPTTLTTWSLTTSRSRRRSLLLLTATGMKAIFKSFGVHGIVAGGQSMNPSVADLLAKVDTVPSDNVIILPNNKNIVAAANQVDELTDKNVTVIKTISMVEGMAALLTYDARRELSTNVEAMTRSNVPCSHRRGHAGRSQE